MMYWMVLGRKIEETITLLFKEGRVRGHHHPGIGVEGIHVGCCYDLNPAEDYIVPSHRGKLPELMMGLDLKFLMAGYYNKKEGLGGGRVPTGSHMYGDMSKHIIPGTGIIGSLIPVAMGAGLGLKVKKAGGVVITFFGDGAANRGDFHEALNMAAAFKLPVVFVLQNNRYSISVSVEKATGMEHLSVRAKAYNIPGVTVEGRDVLAVYREAQKAINLPGGKISLSMTILGFMYAREGKRDEAKRMLEEMLEISKKKYISPWGIALIYMELGEKDQAFQWLEKAYEEHDNWMFSIKVEPGLDSFRSDPRFTAMLKKMGLEK